MNRVDIRNVLSCTIIMDETDRTAFAVYEMAVLVYLGLFKVNLIIYRNYFDFR